jgi:HYR domain-containing protein
MAYLKRHLVRRAVLATIAIACAAVPIASGAGDRATGSLALGSTLNVAGGDTDCPSGAPPEADFCPHRSGGGPIPGLGFVGETYLYFVDTNPSGCSGVRILRSSGQFSVTGKGTLRFDLGRVEQCVPNLLKANQPFTITGGSGVYAGASGAGTVIHALDEPPTPPAGTDTWGGSLTVPGHTFDLTPPTLGGLVNRTVRARRGAKRVRVRYRVTARDLVDGARPVSCQPGSGSRFKVGRTVVKCTATDTSANAATGSFRVVVKRGR